MNDRQPSYSGVVPPVITPLTEDGEVDVASLERVVTRLLDAGVHGLFALGSTGEVAFLTDRLKNRALEVITGANAGQVPVLAGCIEPTTSQVIERGETVLRYGADGVVATAPFYTRIHPVEIERHFRAIHAALDVPLLAYDIPVCVHTKLEPELLVTLARDGVLDGVKDSSGDDVSFRLLIRAAQAVPRFAVLTGHEVVVDGMLLAGAYGVVPGMGNVDPAGYVRLYDLTIKGDWAAAKLEQDRLASLFRIVAAADPARSGGSTAGVGGFKTALRELRTIASNAVALPLRPLDHDEAATIRGHLQEAGLLS